MSPVAPRKTREKRRNVDDNDDDENTAAAAAGGRFSVQLHGLETRRKLIVHHACTYSIPGVRSPRRPIKIVDHCLRVWGIYPLDSERIGVNVRKDRRSDDLSAVNFRFPAFRAESARRSFNSGMHETCIYSDEHLFWEVCWESRNHRLGNICWNRNPCCWKLQERLQFPLAINYSVVGKADIAQWMIITTAGNDGKNESAFCPPTNSCFRGV